MHPHGRHSSLADGQHHGDRMVPCAALIYWFLCAKKKIPDSLLSPSTARVKNSTFGRCCDVPLRCGKGATIVLVLIPRLMRMHVMFSCGSTPEMWMGEHRVRLRSPRMTTAHVHPLSTLSQKVGLEEPANRYLVRAISNCHMPPCPVIHPIHPSIQSNVHHVNAQYTLRSHSCYQVQTMTTSSTLRPSPSTPTATLRPESILHT